MKKYIVIGIMALSACSLMPAKYDSMEYFNAVNLKYLADTAHAQCGNDGMPQVVAVLRNQATVMNIYVNNTNTDKAVKNAVDTIDKQVGELAMAYGNNSVPTIAYCKVKTDIISKEVDAVVKTLGDKR
jgi:hypothetical protein